jgi:hypothetical protein
MLAYIPYMDPMGYEKMVYFVHGPNISILGRGHQTPVEGVDMGDEMERLFPSTERKITSCNDGKRNKKCGDFYRDLAT